jgi:hypothetical protein
MTITLTAEQRFAVELVTLRDAVREFLACTSRLCELSDIAKSGTMSLEDSQEYAAIMKLNALVSHTGLELLADL